MPNALPPFPDCVLVALGFVVRRDVALNCPVWDGAERLVYCRLFPVLRSISAARMGGDGAHVAGLVTVSTWLGMLSVPVWLAVLAALAALVWCESQGLAPTPT